MSNENKWIMQKRLNVIHALKIISQNKGIRSYELVSKLTVNEPFMSRLKANQLIEDLFNDKKITIDEEDVVELCQ